MQIGHGLRYLSQFFAGFAIGFTSVWQLTLVTLAVVPLIAVAGGTYTIIMSSLSEKGEAAYAQAGKVAEEVKNILLISSHLFFKSFLFGSLEQDYLIGTINPVRLLEEEVYLENRTDMGNPLLSLVFTG